jgi:Tol biopolymer transport system component
MNVSPAGARTARLALLLVALGLPSLGARQADDIVKTDPAAASKLEARLLGPAFRVTLEGHRAGEGYFSPDGRFLIFQSEQVEGNPFFQIFILDLHEGTTQPISPGIGKTTCAWIHPDGNRVLFASTHDDPDAVAKQKAELQKRAEGKQERYSWDYDDHFEIYSVARSELGKDPRYENLTDSPGYDAEGSYSPDGSLIAFASNRTAFDGSMTDEQAKIFEVDKSFMMDIYLMNADGTDVRRLTDVPGYDGGPFFSPDGKRICWRRFSENGLTAEIMTMNLDGTDQRQLTRLHAASWAPFYHPSGKYLIFTTNRHGFSNFELYLVSADGGEPVRVTYTDGFDGLPVFTPDGNQLYWTRQIAQIGPSGRYPAQIFRADWNHAAALAALGLDTEATAPAVDGPGAANDNAEQSSAEFSKDDVARHVAYLCRPELEGRMTGSAGEKLATEYVAAYFDHLGLKPAGDDGTYFQEFAFPAGAALGPDNRLSWRSGEVSTELTIDRDWRPLSFSGSGDFQADAIVFAGYGISARSDAGGTYDSFDGLDVQDKWVLVFRYLPENITPERRQFLVAFASVRDKARKARDLGAKGLIVVSGPTSQVREQLVPLQRDAALSGTSIAVISITDEVARKWFQAAGKNLNETQTLLDTGELHPGFQLSIPVRAAVDVEQVMQTGRNAVGRLQVGPSPSQQTIVVGAHIDHLGRGTASSLARDDEKGEIHFGADDNASGVAAMLEIAEYIASFSDEQRQSLKRDIVFAAWSGEELNLQGSKHFVAGLQSSTGDASKGSGGDSSTPDSIYPRVSAYVNMDMVGRFHQSLAVQGLGSSDYWRKEIQRLALLVNLPVTPLDDTNLPTDATSFYLAGVPIAAAFTGAHQDYHTPRDTPDKLDYDRAAQIARFMGLLAQNLSAADEPPRYVRQQVAAAPPPARAGARAYVGSIPDYASDVRGVLITGTGAGSPAEKGGMKADDVIVEVAGQAIENIQDYAKALGGLKVGQAVRFVVMRAGERIELTITPASRD